MKNTEAQILERAKQIMAELFGKYYNESDIERATFIKDDAVITTGAKLDTWTVSINSIFDSLDFLTIADETAEPIYYQNFNMIISLVEKNPEGKYILRLWR